MKIDNRCDDEVYTLHLRLRSTDRNYKCLFERPVDPIYWEATYNPDATASIIFKDTHEIDQLIYILQKFKEDSRRYMGFWE